MKKRGVTVQSTIIVLIILIISAAILLLFLRGIPYNELAQKEACHQSAIFRSKEIIGLQPGQDLMPLNCKTSEITLGSSNKERLKEEIANQMYDCWWMLGEGRLDFFSETMWREIGMFGTSKAGCVICSIIHFEDNLKEEPKKLDLLRYLDETKVPGKEFTYLEYFIGQENTHLDPHLSIESSTTEDDLAVVYMSIKGDEIGQMLKREGLTILSLVTGGLGIGKGLVGPGILGKLFVGNAVPAGATALAPPSPSLLAMPGGTHVAVQGGSAAGAAAGGAAKAGLSTGAKAGIWGAIAILVAITAGQVTTYWTSTHAAAVHCDGNREGCAGVFLVPYKADKIKEVCQNIGSYS